MTLSIIYVCMYMLPWMSTSLKCIQSLGIVYNPQEMYTIPVDIHNH